MKVETDKSYGSKIIQFKNETERSLSDVSVDKFKSMHADTDRVKEILASMKSFGKEKYHKSELLTEMFALQQEIVGLTFNNDHAAMAELRIWDVESYLDQLNQDCGNVADEELKKFKDGSYQLCNRIKAEISGKRGEEKAFHSLQFIRSKNRILKNVELVDGNLRTELDAIVITPKVITIIEVKNTGKNVFIDENGDYFRTGEYIKWDCNIAEKMMDKEMLVRKVLRKDHMDGIQIRNVVVFTNKKVEIQNKCSSIRACFVSQLPCIIDGVKNEVTYSDEEIDKIESLISAAENKESYPFDLDVEQYKHDFASVMAILEEASTKKQDAECEQNATVKGEDDFDILSCANKGIVSKNEGLLGGVVAVAAVAIVSALAIGVIKKAI